MITALLILNWLLVLFWITRIFSALRNLPRIPNLLAERYAQPLAAAPTALITVIVPARNEAQDIEATLRSLLAIESVPIDIIAVNDRSTDATGEIIDRVASEARAAGNSLIALHITELPEGWMGKTHAMALAARQTSTPWLLFTDADILFMPDSLLRAINFATVEAADHFIIFPTMILKTFGELMIMAFLQAMSSAFGRIWRISDPRFPRVSLGVGAFNLIRADVYRQLGGFESLRMEVLEDLRLGFELKSHGYRQRIAFGRDLVRVRWVVGTLGFIRNVTKNFFAVFRFRTLPAVTASAGLAFACLFPFLLPAILLPGRLPFTTHITAAVLPAALFLLAILLLYRYYRQYTGIPAAYALAFPVAAIVVVYAILRSVAITLFRGGVQWRGTFYPLARLRRQSGPVR